jgi:hypothetical protein
MGWNQNKPQTSILSSSFVTFLLLKYIPAIIPFFSIFNPPDTTDPLALHYFGGPVVLCAVTILYLQYYHYNHCEIYQYVSMNVDPPATCEIGLADDVRIIAGISRTDSHRSQSHQSYRLRCRLYRRSPFIPSHLVSFRSSQPFRCSVILLIYHRLTVIPGLAAVLPPSLRLSCR